MAYGKRYSNTIMLIGALALEGVLLLAGVRSFASTWSGPFAAPYNNVGLQSDIVLDDLISISQTGPVQNVLGPVSILSQQRYPAYLATTTPSGSKIGALGIGVASVGPAFTVPEPYAAGSSIGVYGYGQGGGKNYGIHSIVGAGVAVGARADASGSFAGFFTGTLEVQDNPENNAVGFLIASGTVTSTTSLTANIGNTAGWGIETAIKFNNKKAESQIGAVGVSSGSSGSAVGVYGSSSAAAGITVASQDRGYGVYGMSVSEYGIYGHSSGGSGIVAETVPPNNKGTASALWGVSNDFGLYGRGEFQLTGLRFVPGSGVGAPVNTQSGIGIFACGRGYAARYTGKVYVRGALGMGIGSDYYVEDGTDRIIGRVVTAELKLGKATLDAIIAACGNSCR